jgi:beta-lactamase regulating signal transducer with metallopeptidase domain
MIETIFYWVLNISILGSLVGLLVLALRRIKALPSFGKYLLWILPLLRFWLPWSLASQYSLMSLLSRLGTKTVVIWGKTSNGLDFDVTTTNILRAAQQYTYPLVYKTNLLETIFKVAGLVWLIIMVAIILSSMVIYFSTKSTLKDAQLVRDNIYQSDKVLTAAVYGIFKPRIILPIDSKKQDLDYILAHERVHIHRRDNLWRVIAVITASIHWFNPLIWICLKGFLTDMELACDAAVLKELGEEEKVSYAHLLLSQATPRSYYASAFAGAKTRLRIESIMSYKRLTWWSAVCFTLLFMAIAVTVITNAVGT